MGTNIKMAKFLKTNVLDTISRKYKYDPERSLDYLKEIREQLLEVIVVVDETTNYMNDVVEIREKSLNTEFLERQGYDK
jgi:DNA repair ATPase RecN